MKRRGWIGREGRAEVYIDGKMRVFQSGAGIDDIHYNNDERQLYEIIDGK